MSLPLIWIKYWQGIGAKGKSSENLFQKLLPIDAEIISVKIFKFVYIYSVRVTELKMFCEFVGVEY